ncbi:MAG: M23 family metallopeptidase [Cyanobacteria bacterium P01_G01_bin.54]
MHLHPRSRTRRQGCSRGHSRRRSRRRSSWLRPCQRLQRQIAIIIQTSRAATSGLEWSISYGLLLMAMFLCVVLSPQGRSLLQIVTAPLGQLLAQFPPPHLRSRDLFASVEALGVRAIGHAEGNLTVAGKQTQLYWGHTDPGNFRRNQGWCSDQGRGGGDVQLADRKCLERVQQRLDLIIEDLRAAGLEPDQELLAFVNMVDLYNQASPWVSRQFPSQYAQAQKAGKTGETAIVWARVEAFRRNGRIDASGLIGICRRERRPVSDWDCVAQDQRRRARAIERVLAQAEASSPANAAIAKNEAKLYIWPTQGNLSQGFNRHHEGIDLANAEGTIILAAAAGTVTFAGWDTGGLGQAVVIDHGDGNRTVYGHHRKLWVKIGETVTQGQAIAEMGSTGNSTGPHLHFELYRQGQAVDPQPWLAGQ